MNYRVVWKPTPGFTQLSKPGDAGMQHCTIRRQQAEREEVEIGR